MGRSTLDLMIGIGRRLEVEPGADTADWVRFNQANRLIELMAAEEQVWGELLAPYPVSSDYDSAELEQFVANLAPAYIESSDAVIASDEAPLPDIKLIRKLLTVEVNGVQARIVSHARLRAILRHYFNRPDSSNPVVLLRTNEVQVFPEGMSGDVTFNYIKRPSWFAQGSGTISAPGGDDRLLTDNDLEWPEDEWNNGYLLIAHEDSGDTVYAPTETPSAHTIKFTWAGGPANGVLGYRVATRETEMDRDLADLVEIKAALNLAVADNDAANTERLANDYSRKLTSVQPLLAARKRS